MNKAKGLSDLPKKPTAAALDAFVTSGPQNTAQVEEKPQKAAQQSLEATPIQPEEPTQRLTLEIPLSLHVLIKSGCASRRTKIKEEVLALLEKHYRSGSD